MASNQTLEIKVKYSMLDSMPTGKKRLLLVITKSNFGGAQRYVYDLATKLNHDEFEIAVACGGQGELTERLEAQGIPCFTISGLGRDISLKAEVKALWSLAKTIRDFDPDIIHFNSTKAGFLGTPLARLLAVPLVIFTAHGWPFLEPRPLWWRVMAWLGSYSTSLFAHHTIEVSHFDHKAARFPGLGRKRSVIHTAVESFELKDRSAARSNFYDEATINKHASHIWLVTAAELNHNKNHQLAIDAVAEFNTARANKIFYTIIGAGETEAALREQIALRGQDEYIQLVGYKKDVRHYLTAFDIFLLPSKKEGLPYALLEAGLAGLPTIASHVGGISELIIDEVTGLLIDPSNHTKLVEALTRLSENPSQRQALTDNLRQHIEADFGIELELAKTKAIYDL